MLEAKRPPLLTSKWLNPGKHSDGCHSLMDFFYRSPASKMSGCLQGVLDTAARRRRKKRILIDWHYYTRHFASCWFFIWSGGAHRYPGPGPEPLIDPRVKLAWPSKFVAYTQCITVQCAGPLNAIVHFVRVRLCVEAPRNVAALLPDRTLGAQCAHQHRCEDVCKCLSILSI